MASAEWRPWLQLAAFSLVLFLITAATYSSLGVVLPLMVKDQGWNWTEAGLGFTLLGALTGASSMIPAWLIRRFGVAFTVLFGGAVMVAGFLCLWATHSLWAYWIGCGLCGVGYQSMALIPGTHVLGAVFRNRARAFGIYFTFGSLGGVAGPWMVFGVLGLFPGQWRLFWIIAAAAAALVGLVCALSVGSARWLAQAGEDIDHEVEAAEARPANHRIWRTHEDWTAREALATPQFYVLLAAYFSHLLCGVTVASLSVAHLTQMGVAAAVAAGMLSFESLMQLLGRAGAGLLGDRIDPRHLLIFALAAQVLGSLALSVAHTYPMMVLYSIGTGLGFGLTVLAVTVLLLNYYGRRHNLEIFSLTCLVGAASALGPLIGGFIRDRLGSFAPTFQIYAGVIFLVFVATLFMRPPHKRPAAEIAATPADEDAPRLARRAA
ncbi:CynX/NimT family MFS transporter [Caulobacter sp. KR2-114]|uniref:MFS transporter n=1 Tax=Caulobacter sp. KR2-114 TaxID=3400912 RepID=UPI003C0EED6D